LGRLVEQLGSDTFADREKAAQALQEIGPPALPALRNALANRDAETRRRAGDLIRAIEKQAEAARLLAPTRVRLVFKDVPLPQAVAAVSQQTGLNVAFGTVNGFSQRRLNFDTGEGTYWEVF